MTIRGVDASMISLGLYQGSCPRDHEGTPNLWGAGFDVVVLTAHEYQPSPDSFPGTIVVSAPFHDAIDVTDELWRAADAAAATVVKHLADGQSVLVTCQEGRNRSGLVCAIALCRQGLAPDKAVQQVRSRRGGRALSNPQFVKALKRRTPC